MISYKRFSTSFLLLAVSAISILLAIFAREQQLIRERDVALRRLGVLEKELLPIEESTFNGLYRVAVGKPIVGFSLNWWPHEFGNWRCDRLTEIELKELLQKLRGIERLELSSRGGTWPKDLRLLNEMPDLKSISVYRLQDLLKLSSLGRLERIDLVEESRYSLSENAVAERLVVFEELKRHLPKCEIVIHGFNDVSDGDGPYWPDDGTPVN